MPRLPHHHAHWPDKAKEWSVCSCGDRVPYPSTIVMPPPTERAPIGSPVTWEGLRRAVREVEPRASVDITEAVVRYLLKRGVEVGPPF